MAGDTEHDPGVLEAVAEMYDQLVSGTFYERQAAAERWLWEQPHDDITRRIVEGHSRG